MWQVIAADYQLQLEPRRAGESAWLRYHASRVHIHTPTKPSSLVCSIAGEMATRDLALCRSECGQGVAATSGDELGWIAMGCGGSHHQRPGHGLNLLRGFHGGQQLHSGHIGVKLQPFLGRRQPRRRCFPLSLNGQQLLLHLVAEGQQRSAASGKRLGSSFKGVAVISENLHHRHQSTVCARELKVLEGAAGRAKLRSNQRTLWQPELPTGGFEKGKGITSYSTKTKLTPSDEQRTLAIAEVVD